MDKEALFKVFDIYEKGVFIFGGRKNFVKWLNTSSIYFGDKRPIDLTLDEIIEELIRLEYGN